MIKYFRKIRKKLIADKLVLKYLIYAVGEILLVVIGILIAVQINNWNDNKKNVVLAEDYIVNVKLDLRRDTSVLNKVIEVIGFYMEAKSNALKQVNIMEISLDTLKVVINSSYYNIKMNTKAFNTMKNPSVLAVKKYSKLFGNIDNYYVFYQDYLNNFNEWEVFIARKEASFWEEQNEFEISLSDDIPIFQLPSEMKEKIIKRLTSIEGRNYAKISLVRLQSIQGIYKSVNHQAKSLLGQIDEIKLKE